MVDCLKKQIFNLAKKSYLDKQVVARFLTRIKKEKIEFFNLSIKPINKPNQVCKIHYDLWYLVYINRISFVFTKKEFYQAGWFSAEKGLQLIKTTSFNTIVKKLINLKK